MATPTKSLDLDPRDEAALGVVRVAVGAQTAHYRDLVQRLEVLRHPRRGQPLTWARQLRPRLTADLAAATLFSLLRHTIWSENQQHPRDLPLWSTVASSLGGELLGNAERDDHDLPLKVGAGLLDAARDVGLIEDARWHGSVRVRVTQELFEFAERLVNENGSFDLRQRPTEPPDSATVRTKPEVSMLIKRPELPPRVVVAVDKLQRTAWRINRAVLDRVVGNIGTNSDPLTDEQKWIIGEAGMLRPLDRFFIPVRLDYRGRVHQTGGLLTYTGGTDLARGLLEFAVGEVLDDFGRGWLAWHAWQMWGHDLPELPFGHAWDDDWDGDDKLGWVDEAIRRTDRWRNAEHPTQFLAAALALVDARAGRAMHLPVRVDATCSGLQHLALLARDTDLAKTVNLWGEEMQLVEPYPLEPDFYRRVAEETGFGRTEVKRVVLPRLYGAGIVKLSKILAQERTHNAVTAQDKLDARAIQSAAKRLAPRAFVVLDWIKQVAVAHSSPVPSPIRLTMPSGFELIQDYRYFNRRLVKVPLGGRSVGLRMRSPAEAIKKWQQEISFQSSVVHGLDAALLAELVARAPIEHWAVAHDAFAVPANQMWSLLQANREAIWEIYSTDRLAEWTAAWRASGVDVPDPPEHSMTLPREMLRGSRMLG